MKNPSQDENNHDRIGSTSLCHGPFATQLRTVCRKLAVVPCNAVLAFLVLFQDYS